MMAIHHRRRTPLFNMRHGTLLRRRPRRSIYMIPNVAVAVFLAQVELILSGPVLATLEHGAHQQQGVRMTIAFYTKLILRIGLGWFFAIRKRNEARLR